MRKAWIIAAGIMAAALASCQSEPKVISDVHTGNTVYAGKIANAYSGAFDFLQARPFYSSKRGYGINTLYSNYGWIFISQAWSYGRQMNYRTDGNEAGMCGGAGGCITQEKGLILLSESEFRAAAKSGLEFELVGTQGKVTGKIPAARFQEVLTLQGK